MIKERTRLGILKIAWEPLVEWHETSTLLDPLLPKAIASDYQFAEDVRSSLNHEIYDKI